MAFVVTPKAEAASRQDVRPNVVVSDIDILIPHREITIAGETITVRELTFGEQLKNSAALTALTDALRPLLKPDADDNLGAVLDALTAQADALAHLIAISTGKPQEWVLSLPGVLGETLAIHWWGVNQHFFIRRLLIFPEIRNGRIGAVSSPHSSATATPRAG
jgi:hypothetical protein